MFAKFLTAAVIATCGVSSYAATQYNFWFETVGGYTNSAYVVWDGSNIVGGGGTVSSDFNPIWNGATMTGFSGNSLDVFTFRLNTTGSTVYTADFVTTPPRQLFPGQLSWVQNNKTAIYGFSGVVSPIGTVYGDVPNVVREEFGLPLQVPEIDGHKLPQVILLIGGLLLAYRARRTTDLSPNVSACPI